MLKGSTLKNILEDLNSLKHGYDDDTVAATFNTLSTVLSHMEFEPVDVTDRLCDHLAQCDQPAQHTIEAALRLQLVFGKMLGKKAKSKGKKK